ncbi:hypothetical protein F2Q69_00025646 [Brassica cretica]|uniref:Uncharacterized protein n=1 Tax=Brassica cretica TaxID=69181 RepID=A0A8S9RZT4_BRACR|nr:hypothetical protein F2Q69_00025646 [Brassica cretica]
MYWTVLFLKFLISIMANPHEPHFLKPLLLHEGDMVFHVTPFGHECCEIQYTHPHIIKEEAEADDDADDAAGDADDNEHHHKIRGTWAMSSFSFDYCFLAVVTASNLKEDKLVISSCGSYEFYCFEQTMPRDDTLFVFNLVGDGKTTPLMCVCPERKECSELLSKHLSIKSGESSPLTCLRRL